MFEKWLAIFKKDTLVDRAIEQSGVMLIKTSEMFAEAKNCLRNSDSNDLKIDIYSEDNEINRFEREVRRDVLKHLVVSGNENVASSLILVSIIIDIERIGDYIKNIVELAQTHKRKLEGKSLEEDLVAIENAVQQSFVITKESFVHGDKEAADKMLHDYRWVNRKCDDLVNSLVTEEDAEVTSGEAASLALYIRWLKRINSHLRNITTSVTNPFDRIGFKPKED